MSPSTLSSTRTNEVTRSNPTEDRISTVPSRVKLRAWHRSDSPDRRRERRASRRDPRAHAPPADRAPSSVPPACPSPAVGGPGAIAGRSRGHRRPTEGAVHRPVPALTLSSCGVSSGPRPVACDRPWSRGRPLETDPLHATNARRHRRRLSLRSQPPRRGSARDRPGRRDDHPATARISIFRRVRPEVRPRGAWGREGRVRRC